MRKALDSNQAIRRILKRPLTSAVAILMTAGGLGLCIFTFSFLKALLFGPLPVPDGDRIVRVYGSFNGESKRLTAALLNNLRGRDVGFEYLGGWVDAEVLLQTPAAGFEENVTYTEPSLFAMVGTEPLLGRTILAGDCRAGAEPVAVIGNRLWRSRLDGDSGVVGKQILINGAPVTIVGVMPEGFFWPVASQLWRPLTDTQALGRELLNVYGRLQPGVGKSEVETRSRGLLQSEPAESGFAGIVLTGFPQGQIGGEVWLVFFGFNGLALLVLLPACVNLGNLFSGRFDARAREAAVQLALGAPRRRLWLQTLWESALICMPSGVVGLLLAGWALETVDHIYAELSQDPLVFWWRWGLDWTSVALAVCLVPLVTVAAAALPTARMLAGNFNERLRDRSGLTKTGYAERLNHRLVLFQVAAVCVILFVSAFFSVILFQLRGRMDRSGLSDTLTAEFNAEGASSFFPKLGQLPMVDDEISDVIIREIPAVKRCTALDSGKTVDGQVIAGSGPIHHLGVDLLAGRYFDEAMEAGNAPVVLVNETLARRLWGGASPLGKALRLEDDSRAVLKVIGLVGDGDPGVGFDDGSRILYLPRAKPLGSRVTVFLRHRGDAYKAHESLVHFIRGIPEGPMPVRVDGSGEAPAMLKRLVAIAFPCLVLVACFATLLALMGIYGLIADTVRGRFREIGLRRALGASDQSMIFEIVGDGFRQMKWGLAPALVINLVIGYTVRGIIPIGWFPIFFCLLIAMLAVAVMVLIAAWLPGLQAVKPPAYAALRHE